MLGPDPRRRQEAQDLLGSSQEEPNSQSRRYRRLRRDLLAVIARSEIAGRRDLLRRLRVRRHALAIRRFGAPSATG